MFFFIVGLFFAIVAVVVWLWPVSEFKEKRPTAFVLTVIAVVLLGVSCLTIVGTKKVGVVTSFNKPVGTLSNGIHTKWPWQKVHELDGAIQTDNHLCTDGPERKGEGILVRIGNQSVACLDVTVRWRIRQQHSDALYRDYRSFDHIRDSLVTRDLNQALNDVFVDYNPLGQLQSNDVVAPPVSLETLSARVKSLLVGESGTGGRIGDQIEVLSVFIPIVHHDDQTQNKINQYQAAKADTRIAAQKIQTAENEAKANKALRASISNDPNVLVSKCLDLVAKGTALPAGFTCWPGGGAVVVPKEK